MKRILNYILYGIIILVSRLPFTLLYLFSDLLAFILSRIIAYRSEIVKQNIRKVFPQKTKNEHKQITKAFYTHFADVVLEGVKNFSISDKEAAQRFTIRNPELVFPYLEKGKTVICVTAHYGNWEGYALSAPLHLPNYIMCMFYKELSNSYLNNKALASRGRNGTELVALKDTYEYFEKNKSRAKCITLVADQSPSRHEKAIWVDFFGIETACLHGPEKYAKLYDCPVVYLDIQKKKRGFYEIEVNLIAENPNELEDGELTQRYFSKLEKVIQKKPEYWLWSHRRWKQTRNQ